MKRIVWAVLVGGVWAFVLLAAASAQEQAPPPAPVVAGLVAKVVQDDNGQLQSFVLRRGKKELTINVTAETKYYKGHKAATSADVKEGCRVKVELTEPLQGTTGTAKVVRLAPAKKRQQGGAGGNQQH